MDYLRSQGVKEFLSEATPLLLNSIDRKIASSLQKLSLLDAVTPAQRNAVATLMRYCGQLKHEDSGYCCYYKTVAPTKVPDGTTHLYPLYRCTSVEGADWQPLAGENYCLKYTVRQGFLKGIAGYDRIIEST